MPSRIVSRVFVLFAAAHFVFFCAGCRHEVRTGKNDETVSAVITPLQIGPLLLPFGEENVTTYGLATGLITVNTESYGISATVLGSGFKGTNYGISCSPVFCVEGNDSTFNGITAGVLNFGDILGYAGIGMQNGISIFPLETYSCSNGLSVEGMTLSKAFSGVDLCACSVCGTVGYGLQIIGLDISSFDQSAITGCQIGGLLRSSVHGAQIGLITYNRGDSYDLKRDDPKCLNVGLLNFDLKDGFQIGAVNNTLEGSPVQIGLFNTSFDGSPFQIGLLNYNPNGFLPVFPFFNYSVRKGASERFKQYRADAEKGDVDAQYEVACCYLDGHGTSCLPGLAHDMLKKLAEQGHEKAKEKLKELGETE